MNFRYGNIETEYLKSKDPRLAEVIEKVGHIDRPVDADLFSSVVHHIIGQQISTKAQQTIWSRMQEALGEVTPQTILSAGVPLEKNIVFFDTMDEAVQSGYRPCKQCKPCTERKGE